MQEIFDLEFLGRPLGHWLAALGWILLGFLVGRFLSWLSRSVLKRIATRTTTRVDDIILAFVEKPLVFIVSLAGVRLGVDTLGFPGKPGEYVDKGYEVLVIVAVAWALVRIVDAIIEEYLLPYAERTEGSLDDQLVPIARKVVGVSIWGIAFLAALSSLGYDVGAVLAGLGIGGVAVALAAKDTLSNFFGSVAVFIDRPFKINDRVKVGGFDGTVMEIGLRTSRLRTLDGRVVTMQNSTFASSAIENVSSEPTSKVSATLDLAQASGSEGARRACAAIRAALDALPGLNGEAIVGVGGISELGIRLSYIFYVRKEAPWAQTVSDAHIAALAAIEAEGLSLAPPRTALLGTRP